MKMYEDRGPHVWGVILARRAPAATAYCTLLIPLEHSRLWLKRSSKVFFCRRHSDLVGISVNLQPRIMRFKACEKINYTDIHWLHCTFHSNRIRESGKTNGFLGRELWISGIWSSADTQKVPSSPATNIVRSNPTTAASQVRYPAVSDLFQHVLTCCQDATSILEFLQASWSSLLSDEEGGDTSTRSSSRDLSGKNSAAGSIARSCRWHPNLLPDIRSIKRMKLAESWWDDLRWYLTSPKMHSLHANN